MYGLERILFTAPTETQQIAVKEMCLAGLSNNWTRHEKVVLKGIEAVARAFIQAPVVCIRGAKSSFIHFIHGDPKLALQSMGEGFEKSARSLTQIIVIVSSVMLGTLFPQTIYNGLLRYNEKVEQKKEETQIEETKENDENEKQILLAQNNDLKEELKKANDELERAKKNEIEINELRALFPQAQTLLKQIKEENDKLKEGLTTVDGELQATKKELKETQEIYRNYMKRSQALLNEKEKEINLKKQESDRILKQHLQSGKLLEDYKKNNDKLREENKNLKRPPLSTPLASIENIPLK